MMGSLDYCGHGKRLLKTPHEDCEKCLETWDLTVAIDCLKTLARILNKRLHTLQKEP